MIDNDTDNTGTPQEHTPGPWWVSKAGLTNDGSKPIVSADRRIATVDAAVDLPKRDMWQAQCAERDANARLIAAAPYLLEALKAIANSEPWVASGDDLRAIACAALRDLKGGE